MVGFSVKPPDGADAKTDWFSPVLVAANGLGKWHGVVVVPHKSGDPDLAMKIVSFPDIRLPWMPGIWRPQITRNLVAELESVEARSFAQSVLGELCKHGKMTKGVWSGLKQCIGAVDLVGSISIGSEPVAVSINGQLRVKDITQWLALLIVELAARGLANRVRRCALKSCGDFFIAWRTQGRPQEYCHPNHRSQDAVEADRIRKKGKK